jgi:hypothetical protein
MIELSDKKYWKRMGYYDGVLYCSMLWIEGRDNWRMMEDYGEYLEYYEELPEVPVSGKWYKNDVRYKSDESLMDKNYWVIPVRDNC